MNTNSNENIKTEKSEVGKLELSLINDNQAQSMGLIVDSISSTNKSDFDDITSKKRTESLFKKSLGSVKNVIAVITNSTPADKEKKEKDGTKLLNKSNHSIEEVNNFIEEADIKLSQPVKVVSTGPERNIPGKKIEEKKIISNYKTTYYTYLLPFIEVVQKVSDKEHIFVGENDLERKEDFNKIDEEIAKIMNSNKTKRKRAESIDVSLNLDEGDEKPAVSKSKSSLFEKGCKIKTDRTEHNPSIISEKLNKSGGSIGSGGSDKSDKSDEDKHDSKSDKKSDMKVDKCSDKSSNKSTDKSSDKQEKKDKVNINIIDHVDADSQISNSNKQHSDKSDNEIILKEQMKEHLNTDVSAFEIKEIDLKTDESN